jgi:hypothetical protein
MTKREYVFKVPLCAAELVNDWNGPGLERGVLKGL